MIYTNGYSQVKTMFYGNNKVQSNGETAALYSVEIFDDNTHVTIELIPTKNRKRMNFFASRNTVLVIDNTEIPIIGFYRNKDGVGKVVDTAPFSGDWGWSSVKIGEKYYYTLVFGGKIPPGVTSFSMIDKGSYNGARGYGFRNYKLNNPRINNTSYTDISIKQNIENNNDGICGIYEGFDEQGYKLGCIKVGGHYKLIYMNRKEPVSWWRVGDVKATLTASATPGLFKAQWYMNDKSINNDTYIMFKGQSMDVVIGGSESGYFKMYPTTSPTAPTLPSDVNSWTGTGFALNDGYIVTNYHVVEDAKSISIKGVNGDFNKKYNGTIIRSDKNNDLALIKITDSNFSGFGKIPYKIKTSLSDVGEDVFVLGYPLTTTMGDEIKLTTGVVSSKTGFQGDITLYQISAPVQPGNSGGPLFDHNGDVIGVVNAKHNGADNVGYAIKSMYLSNLIESVVSSSVIPANNYVSDKSLPEKVKSLDDYVFLIECSNVGPINNSTTNNQTQQSSVYNYFVGSYSYKTRQDKCIITNIEVTNNNTIVSFCYTNEYGGGGWCAINSSTYLMYYKDTDSMKLHLQKAENIPTSPNKHYFKSKGEKLEFKLYFPKLPNDIDGFDIIESLDSDWQWYGIHLK